MFCGVPVSHGAPEGHGAPVEKSLLKEICVSYIIRNFKTKYLTSLTLFYDFFFCFSLNLWIVDDINTSTEKWTHCFVGLVI